MSVITHDHISRLAVVFLHGQMHPGVVLEKVNLRSLEYDRKALQVYVRDDVLQLFAAVMPLDGHCHMLHLAIVKVHIYAASHHDQVNLEQIQQTLNRGGGLPLARSSYPLVHELNNYITRIADDDLPRIIRRMQLRAEVWQEQGLQQNFAASPPREEGEVQSDNCRGFHLSYRVGVLVCVSEVTQYSYRRNLSSRLDRGVDLEALTGPKFNLEDLRLYTRHPTSYQQWMRETQLRPNPLMDLHIWIHLDQNLTSHVLLEMLQVEVDDIQQALICPSRVTHRAFEDGAFYEPITHQDAALNGEKVLAAYCVQELRCWADNPKGFAQAVMQRVQYSHVPRAPGVMKSYKIIIFAHASNAVDPYDLFNLHAQVVGTAARVQQRDPVYAMLDFVIKPALGYFALERSKGLRSDVSGRGGVVEV
ncbi:uncharacterized protein LTR77_003825 [Saxophila tyrrhenica]|uniref:Uncharacterized protein n=1 Tax=Saxophila tyrrhenica TaxID=1690608 RepID=A0AAV9PJ14_9PEZI|nr:hypothetical protein LTR77_003825 [Saxophila tyrrhenica]